VVSQLSLNRLLVNVHNVNVHNVNVHNNAAGDAILSFDGSNVRAYRPGALLQFRGVVDGYTQNPYILTFVIRNPERDIVWLNHKAAPHHGIFARVFGGLFRLVRRLA
jgi:hypothetical protein